MRSSKFSAFAVSGLLFLFSAHPTFGALAYLEGEMGKWTAALSCVALGEETGGIACIIDPENVKSFQLHFWFDSSKATFESLSFVSPYTQTAAPDLSQIGSGIIGNICGTTSDPPAGDVDIFVVHLQLLDPEGSWPSFRAYACPLTSDYIETQDPITGDLRMIPAADIIGCPEPATLSILASALAGIFGYSLRRRFHRSTRVL